MGTKGVFTGREEHRADAYRQFLVALLLDAYNTLRLGPVIVEVFRRELRDAKPGAWNINMHDSRDVVYTINWFRGRTEGTLALPLLCEFLDYPHDEVVASAERMYAARQDSYRAIRRLWRESREDIITHLGLRRERAMWERGKMKFWNNALREVTPGWERSSLLGSVRRRGPQAVETVRERVVESEAMEAA